MLFVEVELRRDVIGDASCEDVELMDSECILIELVECDGCIEQN